MVVLLLVILLQPPAANSWLGSLIATIIGNLKISISNVHIRYEDSVRFVSIYSLCCFQYKVQGLFLKLIDMEDVN